MVFLTLLVFLSLFVITFLAYFKWSFTYWKRKGVPYLEPTIPTGNLRVNFKTSESQFDYWRRVYKETKAKGLKHLGLYMFTNLQYVPFDIEVIHNILYKDFNYFDDRGLYYNEKDNPLTAHLVALNGKKWNNTRKKLTPVFTSKKIKMIFNIIRANTDQFIDYVGDRCKEGPVDISKAIGLLVINVTGSSAFGLDCNTFKDASSEIAKNVRNAIVISKFEFFKMIFGIQSPRIAQFLRLDYMSKDVSNFFSTLVKDTVNYRKTNQVSRDDFMQMLINLMDSNEFTLEDVMAQAFLFFVAGFETMTHTTAFTLYELCRNVDIQSKLREEVCQVLSKNNGEITYENLGEMQYMDEVISEALRMYPTIPIITRKCVKDYKVPKLDIVIEKDTFVVIPTVGLHYDPEYFHNPNTFDPSRFSDENNIKPTTYLPFGSGPRNCIGKRFGLLVVKSVLAVLLKNYEFSLVDGFKGPLKFNATHITLTLDETLWLNVKKL
ncbi:hypothetical protein RN001_010842 [Aquatica leii]|uniref:Cytochrome P450 n=1 Tax=Aquatica leii TaxID=1421715 RepID=A0AAN7PA98_9COLE|nr:hypothetical protein RN001_010842 [Aquatica leii]